MTQERVIEAFPLSPMRQGMLFQWVTEPHSGVDIEQVVWTLGEALDLPMFRKAWEQVASRHGVFRTSFRWAISKLLERMRLARHSATQSQAID